MDDAVFIIIMFFAISVGLLQPIAVGYLASKKGRDGLIFFFITLIGWGTASVLGGIFGGALVVAGIMRLSFPGLVIGLLVLVFAFLPLILVASLAPKRRHGVRSRRPERRPLNRGARPAGKRRSKPASDRGPARSVSGAKRKDPKLTKRRRINKRRR